MARIESKTISWNASTSSDVQGYRVYYKEDDGNPISYNDEFIEVSEAQAVAPDDFPSGAFSIETDYRIGIGAVDDMGNESDIVEVSRPFDFVPPEPVSGLTVS